MMRRSQTTFILECHILLTCAVLKQTYFSNLTCNIAFISTIRISAAIFEIGLYSIFILIRATVIICFVYAINRGQTCEKPSAQCIVADSDSLRYIGMISQT